MNITLASKAIKTSLLQYYYKFCSCERKLHILEQIGIFKNTSWVLNYASVEIHVTMSSNVMCNLFTGANYLRMVVFKLCCLMFKKRHTTSFSYIISIDEYC